MQTLNTAECEECGDFAGYINLLTCKRVCFLCLDEKPKYSPLTIFEAGRRFGLDRRLLLVLPALKSIPGRYSSKQSLCKSRLTLIDTEEARRIGVEHHGSAEAMENCVAETGQKKLELFRQGRLRRRTNIDAKEGRVADPRRFMAIVRTPWIQKSSNDVEWGFYCRGCERCYRERPMHWRRKYDASSFADHLEECGLIIDGVHRIAQIEGV